MHTRSSQIQVLLEVEVISNKTWQCMLKNFDSRKINGEMHSSSHREASRVGYALEN